MKLCKRAQSEKSPGGTWLLSGAVCRTSVILDDDCIPVSNDIYLFVWGLHFIIQSLCLFGMKRL